VGRGDEAVALSLDLLSGGGASPINRICPLVSLAAIRARRHEPGAWECLDEAVTAADGSSEPSQIVGVRLARAEAYWLEGKASRGQARGRCSSTVTARRPRRSGPAWAAPMTPRWPCST
jgi:hypothetical protein